MSLTVMMGIPGSGKSTWVKEQVRRDDLTRWQNPSNMVVICPDCIRMRLCGDAQDQSRNAEVFRIANVEVNTYLTSGLRVIFDATNVSSESRNNLLQIAAKNEEDANLVIFRTPLSECLRRNVERERVVPEDVIRRMNEQFNQALRVILQNERWDTIENIWQEVD